MKIGTKEIRMETVVASVVSAIVVALLTLWLPDLNQQAQDNHIPIRCEVVKDAGSHPDTSVDASVEVTNGKD